MDTPESLKGRKFVGALWYYNCPKCGAPRRGPLLQTRLEGCMGTYLLTGDGLMLSRAAFVDGPVGLAGQRLDGIRIREVGREPCDGSDFLGDHVYLDWEFTDAAVPA